MKHSRTFFMVSILLFAIDAYAQSPDYENGKLFFGAGYTYQSDVTSFGFVTLHRPGNLYTYSDLTERNGKPVKWSAMKDPFFKEDAKTIREKGNDLILDVLYKNISFLPAGKFDVSLFVNPDTGKINDVVFWFASNDEYAQLSIDIFHQIELALKKQLHLTPTDAGKKLTFLPTGWEFKSDAFSKQYSFNK